MNPGIARPLLHTVHLLTFIAVFVSGVLLFVPGLRVAVTGGYSLVIRQTHRWGGVAFAALPVAVIAMFGARNVLLAPAARTRRSWWQGGHVALTILMTVLFTATGLVLWKHRAVPESLVDASRSIHDWLTYAAAVLVTAHLTEVGVAALIARFKAATPAQSHL
ncbi:MAG TPA: cytochrome b/b6 domain-containing protein [Candidatus Binatia bacterium]|nr:cytochrome b/b6 domain-containing protein [Candidatus Binatia bacterium]